MKWTTKLFILLVLFSWLMVFSSWRFAYPQDIIDHWLFTAIIMTAIMFFNAEWKMRKRRIDDKTLEEMR